MLVFRIIFRMYYMNDPLLNCFRVAVLRNTHEQLYLEEQILGKDCREAPFKHLRWSFLERQLMAEKPFFGFNAFFHKKIPIRCLIEL